MTLLDAAWEVVLGLVSPIMAALYIIVLFAATIFWRLWVSDVATPRDPMRGQKILSVSLMVVLIVLGVVYVTWLEGANIDPWRWRVRPE